MALDDQTYARLALVRDMLSKASDEIAAALADIKMKQTAYETESTIRPPEAPKESQ